LGEKKTGRNGILVLSISGNLQEMMVVISSFFFLSVSEIGIML